jgi:hypothetical protein|tara:strand:- start:1614 stop:2903 length:1290 start_codon:yes stop_codon:yes gene_type:complete
MGSTLLMRKVFLLSTVFLVSILLSCKKDGKLSPDFDNGNLSIIFTDTFSIESTSIEDAPGRTDLAIRHLLGVYNDPIFGVKSSSIYTNVGISGETNFGFNSTIDSLVLELGFVDFYGNNTSSFNVNVFELASPLSSTTTYFSNTYSPVQNTLLGSVSYTPGASDSTLRVVIVDPTLLSNIQGTQQYADNSAFNTVLKGLYIVSSDTAGGIPVIAQGAGAIASFDLSSSLSKLIVHYTDSSSTSLQEDLILNNDVKSYARFINDYTSTDIEKHLTNAASRDVNLTYVSAMNGVRSKIEIPNIKELAKEGNISINKAEITFTLATGTDASPDEILSSIFLTGIDENGTSIILPDDPLFEGLDHYGGTYNATTKSFTYNITKHIHQLVTGTGTDYGMFLVANGSVTSANRIVLNSGNSAVSKIRLEITYSKL